jgi:ABC-type uncharacterized transport system ATPase subunit
MAKTIPILITVGWQKLLIDADLEAIDAIRKGKVIDDTYIDNRYTSYIKDSKVKVEIVDELPTLTEAEVEVLRAEDDRRREEKKVAAELAAMAEQAEAVAADVEAA